MWKHKCQKQQNYFNPLCDHFRSRRMFLFFHILRNCVFLNDLFWPVKRHNLIDVIPGKWSLFLKAHFQTGRVFPQWVILKQKKEWCSRFLLSFYYTDRNLVRSLLEFSIKAAFPSTTLESLVLELEVKRSQIFEQAST